MRPRNFKDMYTKWKAKFDPDTISARFDQVKDIAAERYEYAMSYVATVVDNVKALLNNLGVPAAQQGPYIALAERLVRYSFKHGGATLQSLASGLKAEFVAAYGIDPTVADEVIKLVLGNAPPY